MHTFGVYPLNFLAFGFFPPYVLTSILVFLPDTKSFKLLNFFYLSLFSVPFTESSYVLFQTRDPHRGISALPAQFLWRRHGRLQ